MKKLMILAGIAAMMLAGACTEKNDPQKDTLEVTAANLAGTWEKYIEHDFAQGYQQKYRVNFKGQEYTLWHMHQEVQTINGQYGSLVCVGDKFTGTWEYKEGNLVLTHDSKKASYYMNSINPPSYVYYTYNVETMESDQWSVLGEALIPTLDPLEWPVISLTKETLTVKINMDTFALARK